MRTIWYNCVAVLWNNASPSTFHEHRTALFSACDNPVSGNPVWFWIGYLVWEAGESSQASSFDKKEKKEKKKEILREFYAKIKFRPHLMLWYRCLWLPYFLITSECLLITWQVSKLSGTNVIIRSLRNNTNQCRLTKAYMRLLQDRLFSSERCTSISLLSLRLQVKTGNKIFLEHGVLDKTFMGLKFKV